MRDPLSKPVVPIRTPASAYGEPRTAPKAYAPERRASARYPTTAAADVIELKSAARLVGRTSDLGLGGCYVDCVNPFPPETQVRVHLQQGSISFQAMAAVVYSLAGMGMGMAFTDIAPDQREVLTAWIGELSGEPPPPSGPAAAPTAEVLSEAPSEHNERDVLNRLISLMIKKRLLTDAEGTALLRELFR